MDSNEAPVKSTLALRAVALLPWVIVGGAIIYLINIAFDPGTFEYEGGDKSERLTRQQNRSQLLSMAVSVISVMGRAFLDNNGGVYVAELFAYVFLIVASSFLDNMFSTDEGLRRLVEGDGALKHALTSLAQPSFAKYMIVYWIDMMVVLPLTMELGKWSEPTFNAVAQQNIFGPVGRYGAYLGPSLLVSLLATVTGWSYVRPLIFQFAFAEGTNLSPALVEAANWDRSSSDGFTDDMNKALVPSSTVFMAGISIGLFYLFQKRDATRVAFFVAMLTLMVLVNAILPDGGFDPSGMTQIAGFAILATGSVMGLYMPFRLAPEGSKNA